MGSPVRMCPYCDRPTAGGKNITCRHPRCLRTHRTRNEVNRLARLRQDAKGWAMHTDIYPPGFWDPDHDGRNRIISAMRANVARAACMGDALTRSAIQTGCTVAQVMAVWRSSV